MVVIVVTLFHMSCVCMHHALTQVLKLVFIRNPSGHKNENKVSMKQYHCDENSAVFFFWSEMQKWFAYGPADATATSIISCFIKIRIGFYLSGAGYPGCPGKEAVKQVSVWRMKIYKNYVGYVCKKDTVGPLMRHSQIFAVLGFSHTLTIDIIGNIVIIDGCSV